MQIFGVRALIAVADSTAHPATPEGLLAHFDELMGPQLIRLDRAGIKAGVALGVHPLCLPRRGLSQILDAIPGYLETGRVLAIGQLGLRSGSEVEEEALLAQLALAHQFNRPAIVSAPDEDTERMTKRTLVTLQASELPADRILLDGAIGKTVRGIRELGFFAGLTVHPAILPVEKAVALIRTLGPERLVLGDAAGFGASDIVSLGRAAHRLTKAGLSQRVISRVTWDHAASLFSLE
ncbi:MAG: TatD family hydrolase [Archangium sp.]|nr:TatD family hydrolase [Archangium sp.]